MKDSEIYPKYEFRVKPSDKQWIQKELDELKEKFNDADDPAISKSVIMMAALKHGFRFLKSCQKVKTTDLET